MVWRGTEAGVELMILKEKSVVASQSLRIRVRVQARREGQREEEKEQARCCSCELNRYPSGVHYPGVESNSQRVPWCRLPKIPRLKPVR